MQLLIVPCVNCCSVFNNIHFNILLAQCNRMPEVVQVTKQKTPYKADKGDNQIRTVGFVVTCSDEL